jgi:hypothetical protein
MDDLSKIPTRSLIETSRVAADAALGDRYILILEEIFRRLITLEKQREDEKNAKFNL